MICTEEKIDRGAVLHIPLSQYAFAESEHSLIIRIRAKKRRIYPSAFYTMQTVSAGSPPLNFKRFQCRFVQKMSILNTSKQK